MPSVRIEVKRPWPTAAQQQLIEATHQAMQTALKIPQHDRLIRYVEHRPEHFVSPPGSSDNYTLVEISLFPGRSLDAKRLLYREIVQRFGALGIAPADIRILLHEVPLANWGIRGGIPAADLDLGFKIDA